MSAGAQQQQRQQQVGGFYGRQQPCAQPQPSCQQPPPVEPCPPLSGASTGFHITLPSSRRLVGTPAYNVPCPEQAVYGCSPQQVCETIGGEMQQQQQQQAAYAQPQQQVQYAQPQKIQQAQPYAQGGVQPQAPPQQQFVQGHYGAPMPAMGGRGGGRKVTLNLMDKDNRSSRRYHIVIKGTLAGFRKNPQSAMWVLRDENILKRKILSAANAPRHGDLEKTVILDALVHWTKSTCPKTVIAQCSAFRGNSYTSTGQRGFIVVPSGKTNYSGSGDGKGLRVMRPHLIVGSTLMASYGHMDMKSIKAPLTKVKGSKYTMVPCDHPIMRIISLNTDALNIDMEGYKKMCGNQFPVVDELVENCIQQIHKQVHSLNPWSDMRRGKFTISIAPADSTGAENNWDCVDCIPGVGRGFTRSDTIQRILNTPFTTELYITLVYAVVDPVFASTEESTEG